MRKLFAMCALAMVSSASFAAADLVINRVVINPKGGPTVGGTTDPTSGLEGFEIKNVGDASIDLAAAGVALVAVDNERPEQGELDSYYRLTGTLPAGGVLIVRDVTGVPTSSGSVATVTSPNGVAYSTIVTKYTQWRPDNGVNAEDYELENSGAVYMLVRGFNATNANAYLGTAMDLDDDLQLDWVNDGNAANDLWDVSTGFDAMAVYPGDDTFGDYSDPATSGLTFAHRVVSAPTNTEETGSFTADYVFRLYRVDGTLKVYDDAIAVDLATYDNANSRAPIDKDLNSTTVDEFRSFSGYGRAGGTVSFRNAADAALTGTITGYVFYGKTGNWTSNANFDHLKINGTNYYH